jgi:uncharacterized protein YbaP (TraB family)
MTAMRLLPLLFLLVSCSDATSFEQPPETPGPYLWKAEGEAGTVYLFGTIHVPAPRVLRLPDIVMEALGESDVVLTEIKLTPEAGAKMQKVMAMSDGRKLEEIIPAKTYARINKTIPLAPFKRTKPWAVAQQALLAHGAKYFLRARPMDMMIPSIAERNGLETYALETVDEQIAVLDSVPLADQIEMLDKTAGLIAKDRREKTNIIDTLVDIYLKGDLDEMMSHALSFDGEPSEAEKRFMVRLIDDRNVRMGKRLLARMKKAPGKTWFVAVGAAHHHGKTGLPQLMREAGYKITRVPQPEEPQPEKQEQPVKPTKNPKKELVPQSAD